MLILDCVPTSRTPPETLRKDVLREKERPRIDLISVDAEGAEMEIFRGLPVSVLGHPLHHRGDKSEDLHGLGQPISCHRAL